MNRSVAASPGQARRLGWAVALAYVALAFVAGPARADYEFTTEVGASNGNDGPVSAEAYFTLQNGQITVYLANLTSGSQNQGQAISGIMFKVDGVLSTSLTLTSVSGNEVSLSNGTFSSPTYKTFTASGNPATAADWAYDNPNNGVDKTTSLNDAAQNPHHMILGPNPSFSGSGGGNFNPYFETTATALTDLATAPKGSAVVFVLTGSNVTTSSKISDVNFFFGTSPDDVEIADDVITSVPAPSSLVLALSGCVTFGLANVWRLRRKVVAAAV
jgi:hypothetical protein